MEELKIMDEMNAMEVVENVEVPVESGNGIVGAVVVGVGVAVVGAVGAFIYKNRDRLEARKIEKLKKKGYVIYKEEELESEPEPIEEIK